MLVLPFSLLDEVERVVVVDHEVFAKDLDVLHWFVQIIVYVLLNHKDGLITVGILQCLW